MKKKEDEEESKKMMKKRWSLTQRVERVVVKVKPLEERKGNGEGNASELLPVRVIYLKLKRAPRRGYHRSGRKVTGFCAAAEVPPPISVAVLKKSAGTAVRFTSAWGKGDADGGGLCLGYENPVFMPTLNPRLVGVRCIALGGLHSAALNSLHLVSIST